MSRVPSSRTLPAHLILTDTQHRDLTGRTVSSMKFRFSVVGFVPPNARVALSGSIPALGSWKSAVSMFPMQIPQDEFHPSMWTTTVEIPDTIIENKSAFEYKFIRWTSTPLKLSDQVIHDESVFEFSEPEHSNQECAFPDNPVWEGLGKSENRQLIFERKAARLSSPFHVYDAILNVTPDKNYSLPVALFHEPFNSVSEASHTTHYYRRLKERGEIHYNQIVDRLYVGTCPRSIQQIKNLQVQEKITDFMNFQTVEDIIENYPDPEGVPNHKDRSIARINDIFDSLGIRYVWIPTTDMCSDARARTIAQAAFLLAGLLQRPDCTGVYIHCNAGVGRSVACVVGFLHCCLNIPVRLTNLIVSARRPVAYFDEPALIQGAKDFKLKFGSAIQVFNLPRLALEVGKIKIVDKNNNQIQQE